MKKNGILALQLPDDHENAIPILAAMKKVFKHTVILRWSGIYVFASDRKLTADPEVLDRLRYFENKTQCEVASLMEMSQVQISRLERKILLRLRELLK